EGGTFSISVQVSDGNGHMGTTLTSASVADAPLFANGTTIHAGPGSAFNGVVASFIDSELAATTPSHYLATIIWGNNRLSMGTIYANGSGGFDVSGTNTYDFEGAYSISVNIVDVGGASATANSTAQVVPFIKATGVMVTAAEGVPFSGRVASFVDAD